MEALDRNVLAGPLLEYFGTEMTAVLGRCNHCHKPSQVAELVVLHEGSERSPLPALHKHRDCPRHDS